ncbi:MAG: hypothetical protein OXN84_15710 [Albidovulum sp.]|nr:hypothetical protein [Albidovulum sp.]
MSPNNPGGVAEERGELDEAAVIRALFRSLPPERGKLRQFAALRRVELPGVERRGIPDPKSSLASISKAKLEFLACVV